MLLTAKALLDHKPRPSRDEIQSALSGVLCRCTGYIQIYDAVERAAEELEKHKAAPSPHPHGSDHG